MDRDELFELLDIESGADFQYFENFADLVECEEDIESDVIYDLLEDVDLKTFNEICESFFYDTLESVPGDQIDLYNLLENIKRALIGLAEAARKEEDNALVQLADELNKFRTWYSVELHAECKNVMNEKVSYLAIRDALANARMEKLNGEEYAYDFANAMDYELEEFVMSYADLVGDGEDE
jgi:hypothetical protein